MPITNGMGQREMTLETMMGEILVIATGGGIIGEEIDGVVVISGRDRVSYSCPIISGGSGVIRENIERRTDMSGGCGKYTPRKILASGQLEYWPIGKRAVYHW